MIRAIELTKTQFKAKEKAITNLLRPLAQFTSPTYQKNGLETVNGKVLLLEPKQPLFIEKIASLNIAFKDLDKSIIKVEDL